MQSTIDSRDPFAQSPAPDRPSMGGRVLGAVLWIAAFVIMFSAAGYQRRTGPTYEKSGGFVVGDVTYTYELLRSEETVREARIAIPDPGRGVEAKVVWRRFPTDDPFTTEDMAAEDGAEGTELAAYLPVQPAAGKLEYFVEIQAPGQDLIRIPAQGVGADGTRGGEDTLVLRYKDPVPLPLLLSHVFMMFFAMLIGVRAALGALVRPRGVGKLAWIALVGMTVGGMILGPFVQKYAFGEYWTGWPFGYDLTDNKTLLMWLAWIGACGVLWWKTRHSPGGTREAERSPVVRGSLVAAAVVMIAVYLIPHSFRGSELDYGAVDSGVPAEEAIGVGDRPS